MIAAAERLERGLTARLRDETAPNAATLARLETTLSAAALRARALGRLAAARAAGAEIETVTEARSDGDWREVAARRPEQDAEPSAEPPTWSEY